jgi:hypothetical protein
MEVAKGRVTLNKYGSDVPISDLTPAEAILLHVLHGPANGGRTFGDDFNKIEVIGTAKVATGQVKRIVLQAAVPEKVLKGKQISPAQPEQVVRGEVIKPAQPEKRIPAKGTPGDKDYVPETLIPAQLEQRAPGYLIAAQPATFEPDTIVPAVPELVKEEPILVDRTPVQELARLRKKYSQAKNSKGNLIVDSIWTDRMNPSLPKTFKEIDWTQVGDMASSPDVQPAALNYVTEQVLKQA